MVALFYVVFHQLNALISRFRSKLFLGDFAFARFTKMKILIIFINKNCSNFSKIYLTHHLQWIWGFLIIQYIKQKQKNNVVIYFDVK